MSCKFSNKVVTGLLTLMLLGGMALAADQNVKFKVPNDTMMPYGSTTAIPAGSGFVQIIKGSPVNPPTGTASDGNAALWSGSSYAIIDAAEVKGPVGHFPNTGAAAGGFVKQGILDSTINADYFVRYWPGDGYYASSTTKKTWSSGDPVPWGVSPEQPFSSFTYYKAAAPYPCVISSVDQVESLEQQLYPATSNPATEQSVINLAWSAGTSTQGDANIQVAGDASHRAYELQFSRTQNFSSVDVTVPRDNASVSLNKRTNATYANYFNDTTMPYYARVIAYNYFDSTTGPVIEFYLVEASAGTGGTASSVTFNLLKKTGDFGVNSVGITFASVFDTNGNPIATLGDLVGLINATGSGYVATIGYWDNTNQTEVGFTFNESGEVLDRINTSQNPQDINIVRGLGYQISVTENKEVTLRNY